MEQSLGGDLVRLLICKTNTSVSFVSVGSELLEQPYVPAYVVAKVFVSFPQKRNGIVFSSGVNYLHSGGNIQS